MQINCSSLARGVECGVECGAAHVYQSKIGMADIWQPRLLCLQILLRSALKLWGTTVTNQISLKGLIKDSDSDSINLALKMKRFLSLLDFPSGEEPIENFFKGEV